jgi:serine-aspartate repeat-containing protein C/D/E
VFNDLNGNGVRDSNEPGVGGVEIIVYNAAGTPVGTTTTASDGTWTISGLPNGLYTVRVLKPAGFEFTVRGSGDNQSNVDPGTGRTGTITVNGTNLTWVDSGLRTPTTTTVAVPPTVVVVVTTPATTVPVTAPTVPATTATTTTLVNTYCIGDKIFRAANAADKDGVGLAGITVTLVKSDGTTTTTVTDANGAYSFCSLTAGSYTVKVNPSTLPAKAVPSYDLTGAKINEVGVTLVGKSNVEADFGYILPSPVSSIAPITIVPVTQPPTTAPAPAPAEPSYTGSNSTNTLLWALSLLLCGLGLAGLVTDRRRRVF